MFSTNYLQKTNYSFFKVSFICIRAARDAHIRCMNFTVYNMMNGPLRANLVVASVSYTGSYKDDPKGSPFFC